MINMLSNCISIIFIYQLVFYITFILYICLQYICVTDVDSLRAIRSAHNLIRASSCSFNFNPQERRDVPPLMPNSTRTHTAAIRP